MIVNKNINIRVLSTYAKHMICPKTFVNLERDIEISNKGLEEFENYEYNLSKYKNNSVFSTKCLLEKISKSLTKVLDNSKKPVLLLSDGKDSLSIALAFSNIGIKCKTLTLLRKNDDRLKEYINKVSLELGHEPYFVTVNEIIDEFNVNFFKESFNSMETPVLDQGYMFFLFGIKRFFKLSNLKPENCQFFDGLGNDEYFGYFFSKSQYKSYKLSMYGIWKLLPQKFYKIRWYFRSPAESHGDLSSLATFFKIPKSYDLNIFFKKIEKGMKEKKYLSFRAFSRGKFHDHQCMMGKTIYSTRKLKTTCYFPWLDKDLANYCFNLPKKFKYNYKKGINKIGLRILLSERLGWSQEKRGVDLYFDLDLKDFKSTIVDNVLPEDLSNKILENKFVSKQVKVRGMLELMNFYSFCKSKDINDYEIDKILNG